MPFHGPDETAAFVDIGLNTNAVAAAKAISKIRSRHVSVHAVVITFGEADLVAEVAAKFDQGSDPAELIADWVSKVRRRRDVRSTNTRILGPEFVRGKRKYR